MLGRKYPGMRSATRVRIARPVTSRSGNLLKQSQIVRASSGSRESSVGVRPDSGVRPVYGERRLRLPNRSDREFANGPHSSFVG